MRAYLVVFSVVLVLSLAVGPASAQRLKSIPIDDSFVFTPFRPGGIVNGQRTYGMLALHKIVNVDGRTFVCGGVYNMPIVPYEQEIFQRAAIIASDGTLIKKGLTRLSRDIHTNEQLAIFATRTDVSTPLGEDALKEHQARLSRSIQITAHSKHFSGQTVKCMRSFKRWRPVFADGRSTFTFPSQILVRIPD